MRIITIIMGVMLALQLNATPPTHLEVKVKYEINSTSFNLLNPLADLDETGNAEVSLIVQLSGDDIQSIEVQFKKKCKRRRITQ